MTTQSVFRSSFVVVLMAVASGIVTPELRAALVAHWPLNEGSGDSFEDKVAGNDGFLPDGVSIEWADGPPVQDFSVSFSGDNSFIETPFPGIGGNNPRTIALWVKSGPVSSPTAMVAWGANSRGAKWHFRIDNANGNTLRTEASAGNNWATTDIGNDEWRHVASVLPDGATGNSEVLHYLDGVLDPRTGGANVEINTDISENAFAVHIGWAAAHANRWFIGQIADVRIYDEALDEADLAAIMTGAPPVPFVINGGGETYLQNFDEMGTGTRLPKGWSGVTDDGTSRRAAGLGLTDGFLTVPGSEDDGVLGVLNLGGNPERFGPATADHIPTWTAELADANPGNPLFGQDDVVADNATDRALGIGRENNDDAGQLNFEIEIAQGTLRAFVFDWDLEIWGGDPDAGFRSAEGPGMKVDVTVGGNSYATMTENHHPGDLFDSLEDGGDTDHNATLIDGNVHSVRGMTSGIKEVSAADGAVGNMVQVNFNSNWNDATDGGPNGWFSAVDNVRFRALAPGDADANGVVDVADLLTLLGGQKFNQGVDGVTWEQGDFNADDQFNTGDLLAMLAFLSGTFPSNPYASEASGASDAVADVIVNSETGEVTVDLAGHTVSAIIIESASEIFNGQQPEWDTASQFPSTLPGELGNVLFTSTAAGVDELGAVISAEFLGRDKEFYLQDIDLNILIASEGGALTKGNVIVVPEPSTWLMLGLGSLLLVGWRQGATRRSPGMN